MLLENEIWGTDENILFRAQNIFTCYKGGFRDIRSNIVVLLVRESQAKWGYQDVDISGVIKIINHFGQCVFLNPIVAVNEPDIGTLRMCYSIHARNADTPVFLCVAGNVGIIYTVIPNDLCGGVRGAVIDYNYLVKRLVYRIVNDGRQTMTDVPLCVVERDDNR